MKPGDLPLSCIQGSPFDQPLVFRNVDFTGWTAVLEIKYQEYPYPVLHRLTTENGGITIVVTVDNTGVDPVYTSTVTLAIPYTVTQGFRPKVYDYQLDLVAVVTGIPYPWLKSVFAVSPDGTA